MVWWLFVRQSGDILSMGCNQLLRWPAGWECNKAAELLGKHEQQWYYQAIFSQGRCRYQRRDRTFDQWRMCEKNDTSGVNVPGFGLWYWQPLEYSLYDRISDTGRGRYRCRWRWGRAFGTCHSKPGNPLDLCPADTKVV